MKLKPYLSHPFSEGNDIAGFGTVTLMRKLNGDYYLVGDDPADLAALKEWVTQFVPEAASCSPPGVRRTRLCPCLQVTIALLGVS